MNDARNETSRSLFITGLKNAHAVENEALSIMKPQIKRFENYPEMAERLRKHYGETEGQIVRLEEVLSSLDASHSAFKDTAASIMGSMAAMGHSIAGDEILKNTFANFAFENFEIAAYRSLLTMAETIGFSQATAPLTQTLREEEAMAEWIEENIPMVTRRFLSLSEAGETAKR